MVEFCLLTKGEREKGEGCLASVYRCVDHVSYKALLKKIKMVPRDPYKLKRRR